MMRFVTIMFLLSLHCAFANVNITPPKGWERIDDPEQLPQKVHVIYVGAAKGQFTPSINIASEETALPLQEYVTQAKSYHESQSQTRCGLLGKLETRIGPAQLLQIDRPTSWGNIRFIQGIVVKNGMAYVITATCLQEDFGAFSTHFFKSIQTFSDS